MEQLLPLFPLQVVVFPGMLLPLHIFEERYKEMVGEAIHDNSEFGIILAKEEGIVNIGCAAVVEKVLKKYPDGRMDVAARGRRRFEVLFLDEEKAYLRGGVQYFDDDDPGPASADTRFVAIEQYRSFLESGEPRSLDAEPRINHPQLSFELAQCLDDLDVRQSLLSCRSEPERLERLTAYLIDAIPKRQYAARMRNLAPQNGRGGKPPGLTM